MLRLRHPFARPRRQFRLSPQLCLRLRSLLLPSLRLQRPLPRPRRLRRGSWLRPQLWKDLRLPRPRLCPLLHLPLPLRRGLSYRSRLPWSSLRLQLHPQPLQLQRLRRLPLLQSLVLRRLRLLPHRNRLLPA